jgi:hypothetical protein
MFISYQDQDMGDNYDLYLHVLLLYNYQPSKGVIWRIVSQRKIIAPEGLPEGGINFRRETIRHITLLQGW